MNRRTLLLGTLGLAATPAAMAHDWAGLGKGDSAENTEGERLALVVGCKDYLFGTKLANPVNDARDMQAALEAVGFAVMFLEDPSLEKFRKAVTDFSQRASRASARVFYFAGHGIQVNGVNFLLPVTFNAKEVAGLPDQAVGLSEVMRALPETGVNIVILDACRDNPLVRALRSAGPATAGDVRAGLGNQDRPMGTLIAYATKPGGVSQDISPNGRNGLYTGELLKHLRTPGLTIEQVFKRTRSGVMEASQRRQQPWDESSLTTEFSFQATTAAAPIALPAKPKPDPVQAGNASLATAAGKASRYPKLAAYLRQMCWVPGGSFKMGTEPGTGQGRRNENPVHQVTLSPYALGRHPVTVEMWKEYCADAGLLFPRLPGAFRKYTNDHPMVFVTWEDVAGKDGKGGFCAWASEVAGIRLYLPSEAQWEFAACGGKKSQPYPWGNTFDDTKLWCSIKGRRPETHSVNRDEYVHENDLGLRDMLGNVWEWCSDWYDAYPSEDQIDPTGGTSGNLRIIRGGSWRSTNHFELRCQSRNAYPPSKLMDEIGFRLMAPWRG